MGVAAYNRGTKRIESNIDAEQRAPEFEFMEEINALPKHNRASKPFGPIHFINSHGGWFAECPVTGFGYFYKNLRDAVRSFRVTIVAFDNGVWIGIP